MYSDIRKKSVQFNLPVSSNPVQSSIEQKHCKKKNVRTLAAKLFLLLMFYSLSTSRNSQRSLSLRLHYASKTS